MKKYKMRLFQYQLHEKFGRFEGSVIREIKRIVQSGRGDRLVSPKLNLDFRGGLSALPDLKTVQNKILIYLV